MTPLDGDCLFAAIGLPAIVSGRAQLTKRALEEAASMPKAIRRRVAHFMATDSWTDAVDLPPFDYDEVLATVSAGKLEPAAAARLFANIPDREIATKLATEAEGVLQWANTLIPRDERVTLLGSVPEVPTSTELADFRRLWQVACDPMTVMADLEDGSLFDEQVAVVAKLFPSLYAEMRQAVSDANAALVARRGPAWEPSPLKLQFLGVLMQKEAVDPDLTAAVQGVYAQEAQQLATAPKPRVKSTGGAGDAEATPGQAATAG